MFQQIPDRPLPAPPAVKPDIYSLDTLIAWLELQPGDGAYCYSDNGQCLLAQYFSYYGFSDIGMGSQFFNHGPRREEVFLPDWFNAIAVRKLWVIGAALARAKALRGRV